ncbi:MAG: succinylglutamate desuccinylase/aspartoacylase family protein [Acetobacteraceae bacterium]|nr:succinylglutamate desuccinylase/aspartoacylase family protein [Acetobacteraceae bacterium]
MSAILDLALDRPGRHTGALRVAHSDDRSAYGEIVIPLVSLVGGVGPCVLLSAGIHGDEAEGPLALMRLLHSIEPSELAGSVIIAPMMNHPAVKASRRTGPLDQGNLARLFPGDARGSVTQRIAAAISGLLLPRVEAVLDIHGGGRTLEYIPCAWGRLRDDPALARRSLAALSALGQERTVVVSATAHGGTLTSEAIAQGKLIAGTEIGGAGGVRPETVAAAERAARRFLAHLGLLPPEPALPTRLMRLRPAHFVRSPGRGMFDPTFTLGDTVRAGEIAGFLYDADRPWRAPEALRFEADGLVVARGVAAMVEPGDVVVHLAEDTDGATLLPR